MDVGQILNEAKFDPIKDKGRNYLVRCPNPNHDDKHPSCSVNKNNGMFKCWSCDESEGMQGSIVFLVRLKTGCSWKRAKQFVHGEAELVDTMKNLKGRLVYDESTANKRFEDSEPDIIRFDSDVRKLSKTFDNSLPYINYLLSRGIAYPTIKHFKVRYASRGFYAGRVIFPVHLHQKIRGFVARMIYRDEIPIGNEDKKYLYPKGMEVTKCIYNYDDLLEKQPIIIVEGVTDAIHIWQFNNPLFKNVGAILSSRISSYQLDLLAAKKPTIVYWILDGDVRPDKDKEGKFAANFKMLDLAFDKVKYVILDEGKDPTDYTEKEIIKRMEKSNPPTSSLFNELKSRLNQK